MKKEIAEAILEASETIGLNLEMREDYSGRGMYGDKTHAIVGDADEFRQATCYAAVMITQSEDEEDSQVTVDEYIEAMAKIRTDNMGRSDLVWY